MPLGPVHHVTISVTDMARSIAFYRDILGFRLTMEVTMCDPEHDLYLRLPQGTTAQVAILQAESITIGEVELIQWSFPSDPPPVTPPKRPGDPGAFLLAFEVTGEDLEAVCERMIGQGVKFWSEPITSHIDEGVEEVGVGRGARAVKDGIHQELPVNGLGSRGPYPDIIERRSGGHREDGHVGQSRHRMHVQALLASNLICSCVGTLTTRSAPSVCSNATLAASFPAQLHWIASNGASPRQWSGLRVATIYEPAFHSDSTKGPVPIGARPYPSCPTSA